jgi:hypothetical protein
MAEGEISRSAHLCLIASVGLDGGACAKHGRRGHARVPTETAGRAERKHAHGPGTRTPRHLGARRADRIGRHPLLRRGRSDPTASVRLLDASLQAVEQGFG